MVFPMQRVVRFGSALEVALIFVLPTLFNVVNNTEQVDEPELACNQV